jgi:hypothetical protein
MPFIEKDDVEMSYRRGYEHGAIETFHAVERFLDPAMREVVRAWIEQAEGRLRLRLTIQLSLKGPDRDRC